MFILIQRQLNSYKLRFPYLIVNNDVNNGPYWKDGIRSWSNTLITRTPDFFDAEEKLHRFLDAIPSETTRKIAEIDIGWEVNDQLDIRLEKSLSRPEEASLFRLVSNCFCLPVRNE